MELRRGERDGFVRYFQLLRSPVYEFARRLLGDEKEAVAATNAAFVAAFRRVILDESVTDLWLVTCRCAFEACMDRAGTPAAPAAEPAVRTAAPRPGRGEPSDASRRFEAALAALPIRARAVLLLRDRCGLSPAQMAGVLAVSEEAAGAQLLRAREGFRQAFDDRSAGSRAGTCRQAEQAAAAAVGLGLGDEALRRLHRHSAYCKPCRVMMKTWGDGPVGLAVLLEPLPLPQALATPPVFGGIAEPGVVPAVVAVGVVGRGLRSLRGIVRSRAAAYAVAAACMALAGGMALHEGRARPFFFAESVGPAIRLVVQPPADSARPQHAGSSKSPRPSSAGSQAASVSLASSSPDQVASEPAVVASSGEGAAADSRAGRTAASTDTGSHDSSVARASSAATGVPASRGARWAAAHGRYHGAGPDGTMHHGTKYHGAAFRDAWHSGFKHHRTKHGGAAWRDAWHHGTRHHGTRHHGTRHHGTRHHGTRHDGARFRDARHGAARHGAAKRNGHRARPGHSAQRHDHRASALHGARGAAHHGRSHAFRSWSRAAHSHDAGRHQGRKHAKKNR